MHPSEDEENCWEGYGGFDSFPVHYACKRDRFCNELDCIPNGNNPEKCYTLFQKPASYKEASRICDQLGGNLPTIQSMEDFLHINHHIYMNSWNSSWTSSQGIFKNKNKIVEPCLGNKYLFLTSRNKLKKHSATKNCSDLSLFE